MRELIRASKAQHWKAAGTWLIYTAALGALPFWGLATILWLYSDGVALTDFAKGGQLAVYAAGLLAASIPVMQKESKDSQFKHPKWFLTATIIVIAVAALIFGAITVDPERVNLERLTQLSVALTLGAVILGFLTELVSEMRADPDLQLLRERDLKSLGDKVRRKVEEAHK